ncbi:enoyl-CoA hydratase/isomerase family protein [Bradyrhizobium canariense]|uniref:Enoyl-CoA hydratase/carnithine racemase n=1 Tax=Bradyrhizobium canariense TaxID=255045 RepID=A0A1H1SLW5_9BRAD|nr:enoyl-CoA hydratase/isomerase family protein [Bradyrhizobium canariense]SDS48952.1 Enoyl-CoA hydratase/carnithine racemase [Bradyrhizobium canariense]
MLELTITSGLAIVTLQRAARGNALASDLVERLLDVLPRTWCDPAVHTVILRGEGKHFCTGFDLDGLDRQSDGDLLYRFVRIELLLALLWHAPVRTVAIAAGRTWGAGADMAAACDIRVACSATRFRFPGAGFGIVLGTRRLAARVGEDLARRWLTEGTEISAQQALVAGLTTDIVEPEDREAWLAAQLLEPKVDQRTIAALHRASRADLRDADLAALVRSAAKPGLRERIADYASRPRQGATS